MNSYSKTAIARAMKVRKRGAAIDTQQPAAGSCTLHGVQSGGQWHSAVDRECDSPIRPSCATELIRRFAQSTHLDRRARP